MRGPCCRSPTREAIALEIKAMGLTVRDTEAIAQSQAEGAGKGADGPGRRKDPDTLALERTLADVLGLKVALDHRGEGGRAQDPLHVAGPARRTLPPPEGLSAS